MMLTGPFFFDLQICICSLGSFNSILHFTAQGVSVLTAIYAIKTSAAEVLTSWKLLPLFPFILLNPLFTIKSLLFGQYRLDPL